MINTNRRQAETETLVAEYHFSKKIKMNRQVSEKQCFGRVHNAFYEIQLPAYACMDTYSY